MVKKIIHNKILKLFSKIIFEKRRAQLRNRQHYQAILTECNLLAVFRQEIYVMFAFLNHYTCIIFTLLVDICRTVNVLLNVGCNFNYASLH
jgi:hypothetical protein